MFLVGFQSDLSRQVMEAMPDGVLVVDEAGQIRHINGQAERLFGYGPEELLGQPVELLVPEAMRAGHRAHRAEFFSAGKTRPMGSGLDLYACRKDGSRVAVDVSLTVVESEEGRVAIVIVRDVSERAGLVAALRRSEERYRMLVENASEIFYRVHLRDDPDRGEVEFVSQQSEALTGHGPQDFLSDPTLWLDSVHPDDRAAVLARTEAILASRTAGTRTYRIRNAARGDYHWIDDRIIPWMDAEGKVAGFQGVARDVTERMEAEEDRRRLESQLRQAQKLEAIGRLAGGVAHDFNNLLTVILGCGEVGLAEIDPVSPVHHDLKEIVEAAHRAASLTQQLLAFSRRQTIAPRVLDLNAQLKGIERMLQRTIGEDVDLIFALREGTWPVSLDRSQLDQLVVNLAVNARDAMPDGGSLTIETGNAILDDNYCSAHAGASPGAYTVLTVSDTGHGMDSATLEHIFEPFFTTKEEGKGTGLGLATVYGIVKQNQGYITVYSEPGQGTTVRIYIPRYLGKPDLAAPAAVPAPPAGGHEVLLLVEDNEQLRRLTRRLLERLGYTVLEANDPEHALALCAEHEGQIDLLLTDVVMPVMNGARLSEGVTALRPRIKTLFMSGYPASIIARRGLLHNGIQHLQKPFDANTLALRIREALAS
jgi:PAS domain S-box-containing protein